MESTKQSTQRKQTSRKQGTTTLELDLEQDVIDIFYERLRILASNLHEGEKHLLLQYLIRGIKDFKAKNATKKEFESKDIEYLRSDEFIDPKPLLPPVRIRKRKASDSPPNQKQVRWKSNTYKSGTTFTKKPHNGWDNNNNNNSPEYYTLG